MRICLAGPPTVEHVTSNTLVEHESARAIADRIPLGVLTVAAASENAGTECTVVDLNRAFLDNTRSRGQSADFVSFATKHLQGLEFDLLGLGTMCSSYPVTLRIAAAIKAARPSTTIVLGGPQASVVDAATINKFKAVDVVVRGEADHSFPTLLRVLDKGEDLSSVAGITFSNRGVAVRNPEPPVVLNLDAIPLPAFHLLPNTTELSILPIELGRGCPFSCTFCSTNDFFRRKFRLKHPRAVLDQMKSLNKSYGINKFILVHDMFTVDRKRVVEFCQAMIDSGLGFQWSCSARTDCVDEDLLALMSNAGCRGLFFGIETGSTRMQKSIEKELDPVYAFSMVAAADRRGIETTVSTIIGFPDEELTDLEATMNFVMDSIRLDHVDPQVGILAPLGGTPVYNKHRTELRFDPIQADFSYSTWYDDTHQFEMIKSDPEIFSNFFAVPTSIPRRYLFELKLFFHAGFHRFRWLLQAAHQEMGGILKVLDQWLLYRSEPPNLVNYYISPRFKHDLIAFFLAISSNGHDDYFAMRILAAAHAILMNNEEDTLVERRAINHEPEISSNPFRCEDVMLFELPGNVDEVIAALRKNKRVTVDDMVATTHLVRRKANVAELMPMRDCIARIISMCDGRRSATEIVRLATGAILSEHSVNDFFYQLNVENIVRFGAGSPSA